MPRQCGFAGLPFWCNAALEVRVRRCASIGNSNSSVPFRSANNTVSKRQSSSGSLEYCQYIVKIRKGERVGLTIIAVSDGSK
jgi:hypothetical protein